MKLRGRLTYHLSAHTRATVLRLWARAIESMPYIRVEDVVGVGDVFVRVAAYLRTVFDEASAHDVLNSKAVGKGLEDTPIVTEALAYAATKAVADIQTVLDTLTREAEYQRAFADTSQSTDRSTRDAEKVIADIIDQYNETVTRLLNKEVTDLVSGVEALVKTTTQLRTDTATLADLARRATTKAANDTARATETLARTVTKQAVTDRIQSFNELVAKALTRGRSDSVSLTDSATRTWNYGRSFSEGGLYAEPGYFADNYVGKDLEPIDVFRFTARQTYSELLTASDSVSRVHTGLRSASDSVMASEIRTRTLTKPVTETLSLSETIALSLYKPLSEDARYTEDGYFADNYVSAGLVPADSITVTLNP